MKGKKLIITGELRFIGCRLVEQLVEHNEVTTIDNGQRKGARTLVPQVGLSMAQVRDTLKAMRQRFKSLDH